MAVHVPVVQGCDASQSVRHFPTPASKRHALPAAQSADSTQASPAAAVPTRMQSASAVSTAGGAIVGARVHLVPGQSLPNAWHVGRQTPTGGTLLLIGPWQALDAPHPAVLVQRGTQVRWPPPVEFVIAQINPEAHSS